jgi:hypothetical protein
MPAMVLSGGCPQAVKSGAIAPLFEARGARGPQGSLWNIESVPDSSVTVIPALAPVL